MTNVSVKAALIASCCAIALLAASAAAFVSEAAAAPKWALRQLPPQPVPGGPETTQPALSGVSCPSESLCVAVGALNTVAVSQSPLAGAETWPVVHPTYDKPQPGCVEEPQVSCSIPRGALRAVSCTVERLCVAVGFEGSVYVSTNPTGGAGAWSATTVNEGPKGTHLTSVSCPTASLCVAVSGGEATTPGGAVGTAGRVLTSTDPASNRWQVVQLGGSPDLRGVSCATPSLCVAVAKGGEIFVSTNPTGSASAWRRAASPTLRDLFAVSCVVGLLCAAGDAGGNILTSTDPTTGGGGFTGTNAEGSVQMTGFACPTPQNCVAVTNNADVLTSTDPTGPPSSWTFENLVPFEVDETGESPFVNNALFAASCASTSLCVLVGANSRIFTATDPFAEPVLSPRAKRGRLRPRTTLVFAEHFWKKTVTRRQKVKARFRFYSRDNPRRFLCKPDGRRWRPCNSPHRYWTGVGRHVLRVRAVGRTGLRGPATSLRFKVMRPRLR